MKITQLDVTNTGSGSNASTLIITLGETGFKTGGAGAALNLSSHVGGTFNNTGSGLQGVSFQTFADINNAQNATSGATPGLQTPTLVATPPPGEGYSFDSSAATSFTNTNGIYSMTTVLMITLAPGDQFNSSGSVITKNSLFAAASIAPAPARIALVCTGLPVLGLLWARRRQKA
jgi:hypothetical protein